MKPTTKLSKRVADILYWTLGTFSMTASATIIHAKDDASTVLLIMLGLAPPLLVMLALPFFPDADDK